MRRSLAVFLLALGLFTSVGSFGFFLNDEAELGVAAYNLYQGRLTMDEVPLEYYELDGLDWVPRVRTVDGVDYILESRGTPALGYPGFIVLAVAEGMGNAQWAFILTATIGLFGGAAVLLKPRWDALPARRAQAEAGVLAAAAVAFLAVNVALARDVNFPLWGPPFAVQFVMLFVSALGVAAFHVAVTRMRDPFTAHVATAVLVFGTTFAFWAHGQKYHAAQIVAVILVMLLRFTPGRTVNRHAAAYAVAGLAVWLQLFTGVLLLLALAAVDALTLLKHRHRVTRAHARTAGVLALGLAIGLAPYVVENTLLYGTPLVPGYIALGNTDLWMPGTGAVAEPGEPGEPGAPAAPEAPGGFRLWERVAAILAYAQGRTIFADVPAVPGAAFEIWILPDGLSEIHYGMLVIAPLLALAPFGVWERRRAFTSVDAFLGVHAALILIVFGLVSLKQGGGYEPRWLTPLYPALAFYAATFLAPRVRAHAPLVAAGVAASLIALLPLAALAMPNNTRFITHFLEFFQALGLAALAILLLWVPIRLLLERARVPASRLVYADVPVLAIALLPTVWFYVQHQLILTMRTAHGGQPEGPLTMFLPVMEVLREGLRGVLFG